MDDVWGNAWAQPEEDVANSVPAKRKVSDGPAWSFPSAPVGKDEEADVGMPSWSTGELNWTEPTGQASLWSSESTIDDLVLGPDRWGAGSTLKPKLDFASTSEQLDSDDFTVYPPKRAEQSSDSPLKEEGSRSSTPVSVGTVTSVPKADANTPTGESPPSPTAASLPSDTPESSDAFGSFEDGLASASIPLDEDRITWETTTPVRAFDDATGEEDAWGSAWRTPDTVKADDKEPKDEWTIAHEEKARRDHSVPPELLGAIIDRLNELSVDLWPEKDKPQFEQNLGNWRDGMANVPGLEALMQRVLPETTGQPPIQFSRSHVAKAMAKSIKLSKNLPIVRNSPMSHLFTAKSLAAWELSVKNKVEVRKDDIPVGWKTLEPEEKGDQKLTPVEKKSSGIFSFFSKRASTVPSPAPAASGTDSKRSSLSREVSSDAASISSPVRNSMDATSLSSKMQQSSSITSPSSSVPPSISSPIPSLKSPTTSSPMPASSGQVQSTPAESATPAPSAVSRFLNRFSRTRSDTRSSSSSPRSSIALSTDDIEFLSDIVPSHSDEADENEQLNALTALVSSPAVPAKLPPPLAPPPPPPLAPPPRPSSTSRSPTPHLQPHPHPLMPSPLKLTVSEPSSALSDLMSLDARPTKQSIEPVTSNGIIPLALPPPLPPPLSPTSLGSLSKPPTPSPLSGGAVRARQSTSSSTSPPTWFRSSATPPPKVTSPHPPESALKSLSPVSTGMTSPGSSSVVTPVSESKEQRSTFFSLSPSPPPPIEKSPNRTFVLPSANLLDDNDEFSDFQSHETSSAPVAQTECIKNPSMFGMCFGAPLNTTALPQIAMPHNDPFDDFGDFTFHSVSAQSPPLRSISPTSPPVVGIPPPLPKKQVPANLNTLHMRKPSAADHDATARLLERAAARPGRWPAPPSPLPNPLPPPPSSSATSITSASGSSLLEDDGTGQAPTFSVHSISLKPIAQIMPSTAAGLSKPLSPPPLLPPPSSSSGLRQSLVPQASLLDFEDFPQPAQSSTVKTPIGFPPPSSSSGSAKSGLSAQELSFFEGL